MTHCAYACLYSVFTIPQDERAAMSGNGVGRYCLSFLIKVQMFPQESALGRRLGDGREHQRACTKNKTLSFLLVGPQGTPRMVYRATCCDTLEWAGHTPRDQVWAFHVTLKMLALDPFITGLRTFPQTVPGYFRKHRKHHTSTTVRLFKTLFFFSFTLFAE